MNKQKRTIYLSIGDLWEDEKNGAYCTLDVSRGDYSSKEEEFRIDRASLDNLEMEDHYQSWVTSHFPDDSCNRKPDIKVFTGKEAYQNARQRFYDLIRREIALLRVEFDASQDRGCLKWIEEQLKEFQGEEFPEEEQRKVSFRMC